MLNFVKLIIVFYKFMYLFIKILNGLVCMLIKIFGIMMILENEVVYSEEELCILLFESFEGGEIN